LPSPLKQNLITVFRAFGRRVDVGSKSNGIFREWLVAPAKRGIVTGMVTAALIRVPKWAFLREILTI
jgi:hypothetical protein